MLMSAYIGLLTSVGTVGNSYVDLVEATGTGYARQAVRFSTPRTGISKLAQPYSFGFAKVGQTVGRGIWSRAVGGALLMILPYGNGPRPQPGGGPVETRDVGDVTLNISTFAGFADGAAYTGPLSTSTVAGSVYDQTDALMAPLAQQAGPDGVVPRAIITAQLLVPAWQSLGGPLVLNGAVNLTGQPNI